MIIVLGGRGRSTRLVANYLAQEFQVTLIQEDPVPRWTMLKRRAKRLGWFTASGQLLFIAFARLQERLCARRIEEIEAAHGLNSDTPQNVPAYRVASANDDTAIELLQRIAPKVVVVNGTRILSARTLRCVDAPFINTHAGITPRYRGVHGAYWALVRGDAANAGVTVHLVDTGVDTGKVLYQNRIQPGRKDCFSTYPTLQLAAGLPLLKRAVHDAVSGRLRGVDVDPRSEQFYHPTLWGYVAARLRGIR